VANTNTLTTVIPQLLAQGLLALRQMAVMPRYINRAYETVAGEKGSSIDVPIPSSIAVQDVSPSYVAPNDAATVPTSVNIPLNQWKEAPFFLSDKDLIEAVSGVIPMQASEAIKALANQVDNDILALYKGVYGFAGTAGTTPFATDLQAFVDARKVLNNQLAPMDPRYVVLNPDAEANALLLRAFQDASFRGDTEGIINGQIGNKLGSLWFTDQNVPTHTAGTWSDAGTTTGANAAGQAVVNLTGGTGSLLVGDIITFSGADTQTYAVTAATGTAPTTAISVSPVLATAKSSTETVTNKASHAVNMNFHRDAFALASRPFAGSDPLGLGMYQSAVDPVSGLTLRLEVMRQHKRTRFSYDILYGVKLVRAQLASRLAG
jgi:hypothetical protein